MISPANVLTLASAEMRTIRRLFRFWFFGAAAILFGLVLYGYYWGIHGLASSYSATVGAASPRYLLSQTAAWQTMVLAAGVIFLAFDLRARDRRDRVIEVLDSKPYTNVELLLGRFAGALAMVMGVALLALLLIQGIGYLASALGWYFGEPTLWGSVWAYLLLDALPALALHVAFVQAAALLTRNRLAAALAGIGLLTAGIWASIRAQTHVLPIIGIHGGFTGSISELAPELWTFENIVNRGSVLLLAIGLLGVAAAVHPRPDDSRRLHWGLGGGGMLAVGGAVMVAMLGASHADLDQVAAWRDAHQARQGETPVDLQHLRGSADIHRGGRLDLDLELGFLSAGGSRALFSLNPGLEVEAIEDASGSALAFSHDDGLLDVDLGRAAPTGEAVGLRLRASGRPDRQFAYLDSVVDFERLNYQDAQIILLGIHSGIMTRNTVVLMPGMAFLPRPGSLTGIEDPRKRSRDFFDLDLEVRHPAAWTVAGPGAAERTEGATRFRPQVAVPEVGLVAGVYDRRTAEVAGVEVEVLFDRRHLRNLDFFADAAEAVRERAERHFATAREVGLPYPFRQLTLVEVPWTLRGYGGGWRMDSTRAPPGMLLIAENSLPTSRFEFAFRNPEQFEDREGGLAAAKALRLEGFFDADFLGGNILAGGARQLFLHRTGARGPEALALEALLDNLVNRLVTGSHAYFSAHLFDRTMGITIAGAVQSTMQGAFFGQASGRSVAASIVDGVTDRPEVWDFLLDSSLVDLDVEANPRRTVNALHLKTSALATAILEAAGRERTGAMIAGLVREHGGGTFDAADLQQAALAAGIDLNALVGDFLHDANLPGFIASPAELVRLADDDGAPRYETRLFIHNGEPTPGLFRLRYAVPIQTGMRWDASEPVQIAGETSVELGLVTSSAPVVMLGSPYLALNRGEFPIDLPPVDEDRVVDREPLQGARPADWRPSWLQGGGDIVIVDDLDEGFSIDRGEAETGGMRVRGGLGGIFSPQTGTDQGLPVFEVFFGPPREWSRFTQPQSWGRYRRTTAIGPPGDGTTSATFTADLPASGRWRVELHVPSLSPLPPGTAPIRREVRIGSGGDAPPRDVPDGQGVRIELGIRIADVDLTLQNGGSTTPIDFDAAGAGVGWAVLGDFDLVGGPASLVLGDRTAGSAVAADAVRFVRLDSGADGSSAAVGQAGAAP